MSRPQFWALLWFPLPYAIPLGALDRKAGKKTLNQQSLWAIPLGGLGEFGMNMMALRCGEDIIVIDAGLMFPEQELLGVDIVIPDITYLKQHKSKVRAIVLTHAHEDHIGAIPYILPELNVPIYGTEFTLAIVKKKLEEHGLLEKAKLNEVKAGETTVLGPFSIEYLHVTHSTIDCVALAVRTPVGVIIHTGDFKIDHTPVDGKPFDMHAFARYGQEGVLALFSDSTNVERAGFTPSERAVVVRLEELFRAAPAKVVVSCFSSSVHRVQQVIDIARMVGRKIGFVGRSMVDNVEIAHGLGKLRVPDGSVVRPQDIRGFDPRKLVVLASGTQAEPLSALSRISVDNHRLMSIAENDTVILSSRIIPGNEKAIFRMIDHFFRRRVLVYYEGSNASPDPRFGTRQPGRNENPAATGDAEIFHPGARRIPPAFPPFRAGRTTRRRRRADIPARKRPAGRIHRRWRRASPRPGAGRPRDGRFRVAGRN